MPRLSAALALACLAWSCGGGAPPERYAQKLVILGFDGMDPDLTERWIKAGMLPHLATLAAQGGVHRLETTPSPESPTAWASFATGMNAGKHNIFGGLARDPRTYAPAPAMAAWEPPRFLFNYFPLNRPRPMSTRGGTSFWVTAGQAGVRPSILTVPMTFPPETVLNGELLSGLPVPDIRGTLGTFHYLASDLSRDDEGQSASGGILRRLVFQGNVARAEITGPPNPIVRQQERALRANAPLTEADRDRLSELASESDLHLPIDITWNHEARTANIVMAGESIHLAERQWSRWIPLDFRANALVRIHGMTQLFLIKAGTDLQVYVAPINWHPSNPPAPISAPAALAADLYERVGPYRTLGWPEATWPLIDGRIDEQAFMDDLDKSFNDRAAVILSRLDARQWDLLVGVIEATDRVQHVMWRYIDPDHPLYDADQAARWGGSIAAVYQKADWFVGQVMERLAPGTALMVVSDHGFHSFRYGVNLNTWLVSKGYMTLRGARRGAPPTLADLYGAGTFWDDVDWPKTRAYAMGLGQVYVNLQGREGQGAVAPGADYDALVATLAADLKGLIDHAPAARWCATCTLAPIPTAARTWRPRPICRWGLKTDTGCRGRRPSAARPRS